MHRDRDFNLQQALPWNQSLVTQDLELETLLHTMAGGDDFLFDVARVALLSGLENDVGTILYRQEVAKDCLANQAVVVELYNLTVEATGKAKRLWWGLSSHYPDTVLFDSLALIELLLVMLRKLRRIAEEAHNRFESEAFKALFAMLVSELSDAYLVRIENHLEELKFRMGVWLSAQLGDNNEGTNYMLIKPPKRESSWLKRVWAKAPPGYTFHIDPRDETGAQIVSGMRHRGINGVAITLSQSADHVLSFFKTLQIELAFYMGCLKLHGKLAGKGEPVCFPMPVKAGERLLRFSGLYDACLSLHMESRLVGHAADIDGKNLTIVTGANQGGKSSFLRSIGLAQLMMQCGMFVGAESFQAEVCLALCTHYKREEDATMKSGKLDEELARMSKIADHIAPNSMLLFNESFAATNEREGSEIARQIVLALLEKHIKIFFVTHLYEFARGFYDRNDEGVLFLRAERLDDGTRTFKLLKGEPLETSYGEDLYRQIFGVNGEFPEGESNDMTSISAG
jgi:hypothetical protein